MLFTRSASTVEAFVHQSSGGYKSPSESSPRVTWSSAGYQSRCPFGDINIFQVCGLTKQPIKYRCMFCTVSQLPSLPLLIRCTVTAACHLHHSGRLRGRYLLLIPTHFWRYSSQLVITPQPTMPASWVLPGCLSCMSLTSSQNYGCRQTSTTSWQQSSPAAPQRREAGTCSATCTGSCITR